MNQPERGGPQHIPRPHDWTAGSSAPWPHTAVVDLDLLEHRLSTRTPGYQKTGAPPPKRHSAVLIALYSDPQPTVVLTRRTQQMRAHSGEVSFPGGGQDPGESLWDTACREAREEIRLDTTLVRKIGELDHLTTFSSQARIVPYVARLPQTPSLTANPGEVEEILHVPLSELLQPGVYREERWRWPGSDQQRPIYFFYLSDDTVWGATANLLRQLLVTALGLVEHDK